MQIQCKRKWIFLCITVLLLRANSVYAWQADNNNGTFTNPLFYDEFSDPDLIRVGDDFYMTGTTMHSMPGLPVLHSKDLINWNFLTYACNRLDLGPEFRLENGGSIYGQGIWAPCLRYHQGSFYIFSNVNGRTTQVFTANDPAGSWKHTQMKRAFHDVSVLFDDDGKVYIIWGYQGIRLAELNEDLTDIVPGTERVIIDPSAGMGEGVHFYKLNGKYYITSAWFAGRMRMPCARADRPDGPYEVNQAISANEDFGLAEGYRLWNTRLPLDVTPPNNRDGGRMSLHQGGVVDTPKGEWWGFSMMDYNSVGRLTSLSPVTWKDGWPYFGLPGNLTRTPRTWVKPNTGNRSEPCIPYQRNDDFTDTKLANVWQWNHAPDDSKWSLEERPGFLRLHSLPAGDLWSARNTLTQRSIGPASIPVAELDASGLQKGDVAGLALMNFPYAWIGVKRDADRFTVEQMNQLTGQTAKAAIDESRVWLRADCDFLTEKARFSYSTDGKNYQSLGDGFTMIFQLKTFQGVRYSLYHYNTDGAPGGYADFDRFTVEEPHPRGMMKPIPYNQEINLSVRGGESLLVVQDNKLIRISKNDSLTQKPFVSFKIVDRGLGRVAFQSNGGYLSVVASGDRSHVVLKTGDPTETETFQWMENVYGDLILMSLTTNRYLCGSSDGKEVAADHPGPLPDRCDGSCFVWETANSPVTPSEQK
jgi:xylan 1,4-beta-xylosidase